MLITYYFVFVSLGKIQKKLQKKNKKKLLNGIHAHNAKWWTSSRSSSVVLVQWEEGTVAGHQQGGCCCGIPSPHFLVEKEEMREVVGGSLGKLSWWVDGFSCVVGPPCSL